MLLDDHIPIEELARLAEGQLTPETAAEAMPHLARCRSCMAAYADAIRYRAAWLARPDAFEPPDDLMAMAQAVAGPRNAPARPRASASPAPRRWAFASALAGASVLALLLWPRGGSTPVLTEDVRVRLSRPGTGLILPGAVAPAHTEGVVMRGGGSGTETPGAVPETRRGPERDAYILAAGRLANDDLHGARLAVERALERSPDHRELLLLRAGIAYRESDLELASELVSRVLDRAPGDPVALADRALLRLEHGDSGVALPALRALASRPDELGERVRAEMAERQTPQ